MKLRKRMPDDEDVSFNIRQKEMRRDMKIDKTRRKKRWFRVREWEAVG